MAAWALKDVETSAKEVFERAFTGEPQIVTRHGVPSLVIITYADYEAKSPWSVPAHDEVQKEKRGKRSLVDALSACPCDISELIEKRVEELPSAFDRAGGFTSEEYA